MKAILAAAVLLAATTAVHAEATRVLVMPFSVLNVPESQQWIGKGVQENIVAEFGRAGDIMPITFQGQTVVEDNATAARLARTAQTSYAVRGAAQQVGTEIRITAQLVDAKNGDTVRTASVTGPADNMLKMEDQIAAQLRGVADTPAATVAGATAPTAPASAPTAAPVVIQQPAQPQIIVISSPQQPQYQQSYPTNYYDPYAYSSYYGYGYPYSYYAGYPYYGWPYSFSFVTFTNGHDHGHDHDHDHDHGGGGGGGGGHWPGNGGNGRPGIGGGPTIVNGNNNSGLLPLPTRAGGTLPIPTSAGNMLPLPSSGGGGVVPLSRPSISNFSGATIPVKQMSTVGGGRPVSISPVGGGGGPRSMGGAMGGGSGGGGPGGGGGMSRMGGGGPMGGGGGGGGRTR